LDILYVRDDFFPISAKDFKDMVKGSFAEIKKGKFGKNFRSVVPVVRSLYAEVIRQFVADEGSKQIININTPCLVFPENIAKVQDLIQFINEENCTDRKGFFH